MFKIQPAKNSTLDASEYTLRLPSFELNLFEGKNIASAKTIGGGAAVSVWASNIAGARRSFELTLLAEKFAKLKAMTESSEDEFLLSAHGRVFLIIPNLISAIPLRGGISYRITGEFVFVSEAQNHD